MVKFFVIGIAIICALFFINNSFTSLTSLENKTSPISKEVERITDKNKVVQTKEFTSNEGNSSSAKPGKSNEYIPEHVPSETGNQKLAPEGKDRLQSFIEKQDNETLQDLKSTHGEAIIKKIRKDEVTMLSTDDKRLTGLQMQRDQVLAVGEKYVDDKISTAEAGIKLPDNKHSSVSTESYRPDGEVEPRY